MIQEWLSWKGWNFRRPCKCVVEEDLHIKRERLIAGCSGIIVIIHSIRFWELIRGFMVSLTGMKHVISGFFFYNSTRVVLDCSCSRLRVFDGVFWSKGFHWRMWICEREAAPSRTSWIWEVFHLMGLLKVTCFNGSCWASRFFFHSEELCQLWWCQEDWEHRRL